MGKGSAAERPELVPSAEGAIEPELEAATKEDGGLEIRPDTEATVMFAVRRPCLFFHLPTAAVVCPVP